MNADVFKCHSTGIEPAAVSVADYPADIPDSAHIDNPFLGFSQARIPLPPRITFVTKVGLEPTLLSEPAFETGASTNSATKICT